MTTRTSPHPQMGQDQTIVHSIAVAGLAGVFAYQGLVPKLWKVDREEVAMWQGLGLAPDRARRVVRAVGTVEAAFAVVTLAAAKKRWPFLIAIATMPALAVGAAQADRAILTKAFNPASLGIAVVALASVALATT